MLRVEIWIGVAALYLFLTWKLAAGLRSKDAGKPSLSWVDTDPILRELTESEIGSLTPNLAFLGTVKECPGVIDSKGDSYGLVYRHPHKPLILWFAYDVLGAEQRVAVLQVDGSQVREITPLDLKLDHLAATWDTLAEQTEEAELPSSDSLLSLVEAYLAEKSEKIVGCFKSALPNGRARLSWWSALGLVRKMLPVSGRKSLIFRNGALTVIAKKPGSPPDDHQLGVDFLRVSITAHLDLLAYNRTQAEKLNKKPSRWLLPISLVLFVLSFARLGDGGFLSKLVLVIFLHELGHWAAMRLLGYQNTSFFFIPFFGGAAIGVKKYPSLREEILVFLAGPMPGLFIAFLIGYFTDVNLGSWMGQYALLSWFINAANLLPIFPLDGGRVLNALLFSRWPLLELAFKFLAIVALIGGGIYLQDVIMPIIGVTLLLGLGHTRKLARICASIRRQAAGELPTDDAVAARVVEEFDPEKSQQPVRLALLGQVFPRLSTARGKRRGVVAWLLVYLLLLVFGLVCLPLATGLKTPSGFYDGLRQRREQVLSRLRDLNEESNGFHRIVALGKYRNADSTAAEVWDIFPYLTRPAALVAARAMPEFASYWDTSAPAREECRKILKLPTYLEDGSDPDYAFAGNLDWYRQAVWTEIMVRLSRGQEKESLDELEAFYKSLRAMNPFALPSYSRNLWFTFGHLHTAVLDMVRELPLSRDGYLRLYRILATESVTGMDLLDYKAAEVLDELAYYDRSRSLLDKVLRYPRRYGLYQGYMAESQAAVLGPVPVRYIEEASGDFQVVSTGQVAQASVLALAYREEKGRPPASVSELSTYARSLGLEVPEFFARLGLVPHGNDFEVSVAGLSPHREVFLSNSSAWPIGPYVDPGNYQDVVRLSLPSAP